MMAWLASHKFLFEGLLDAWFPARKAMREVRARWGRPASSEAPYASRYFDLVRDAGDPTVIDDKTWADLEFPELFAGMNATLSPVGRQVLYRWLREPRRNPASMAANYAVYARLQRDVTLREALQRQLLPLADERHARITDFLFDELPPELPRQRLLYAWALALPLVLIGAWLWAWLWWVWFAMVLVNLVVLARIGITGRTLRAMRTLRACLQLVKVANNLAAVDDRGADLPPLAGLRDERGHRARLSRALGGLLMWTSWSSLFPLSIVVIVLNVVFLVELLLYVRTMRRFARLRDTLAPSFEWVGALDAAIAVASWLAYCPHHCRPVLVEGRVLDVRDGRHPLLPEGVGNSVRLDGRSALVTGSNMAGKTTFIKMLAVNVLLAQTLGFCVAAAATVPRARVRASIHTAHSVASGKSHYFAEIETLRSFLVDAPRTDCALLVIDEPFSGTNTVERVAIARAMLERLGQQALVLATTHDVELQAALGGRYDLYHFQEDPDVDGFFDYRLRPGPTRARNAIRLLREMQFPEGIVTTALRYAGQAAQCDGEAGHAVRRAPSPADAAPCVATTAVARRVPPVTLAASPITRVTSMPRQAIHSDSAPKAIGPYSQGVRMGGALYLSGQIPIDPATGAVVTGGAAAQARQVFQNLKAVLAAGGATFADVARVGIFMTDLGNFGAVNDVMKEYFSEPYPARATIGVAALPKNVEVEIEVIAIPSH